MVKGSFPVCVQIGLTYVVEAYVEVYANNAIHNKLMLDKKSLISPSGETLNRGPWRFSWGDSMNLPLEIK